MGILNEEQISRLVRRLRSRVRQYREMLNALPYGIVIHEAGQIRLANNAAVRMLGATSASQLIGKRYSDLVLAAAPLGRPQTEQQTLRRMDGRIVEVESTTRLLKRGQRRYAQIELRDARDAQMLQHAEVERRRALADAVSAVVMLGPTGDVTQWSATAESMTGFRALEVVGRPASKLLDGQQGKPYNLQEILPSAARSGHAQVDTWMRRKSGSPFYAAHSFNALLDHGGAVAGFALTMRDLTAQPAATPENQTEQQIRQAQRMEAVGRLASGIAHDFNNLLTAIQGHAQFLTEDLSPEHPSRADAEEILHSAERAAALTRQLLAFSRGQVVQPEAVQLNTVITAMERLLRRVISEDISVESQLEEDLWPVRADPTQLEQILVNLMVNARDAMPQGGRITIKTANAQLSTDYAENREEVEPGDYVMLAISDTGVGMDRATQARIFEPFFTTKEPDKGTGLGLSTVFGIIKQMGGHIFVYSEAGHGTTFKIYLPRAGGSGVRRRVAPLALSGERSNECVLIVEDDDAVRALARRVLDTRGYRVRTCSDAEEALDIMQQYGDDMSLVISDVVMPGMNGQELSRRIRTSWPHVAILFMSGYTDDDVRRNGLVGSADYFIEKPFTPDSFAHKVRTVLDERALSLPRNQR